jgi:hypothetical protein
MRTFICAATMLIALAGAAIAQAGSTGGTLGNTDKSISGERREEPSSERKSRERVTHTPKRGNAENGPCQKVVGSWSWVVIGVTDHATFFADHTAIHTQGGAGHWSCSDGQYQVTWTRTNLTDHFTVSSDGSTLSGTSSIGTALLATRIK